MLYIIFLRVSELVIGLDLLGQLVRIAAMPGKGLDNSSI
jgi:hypothetical protein